MSETVQAGTIVTMTD